MLLSKAFQNELQREIGRVEVILDTLRSLLTGSERKSPIAGSQTFAQHVRTALGSFPSGATSREVAEALEKEQIQAGGAASLTEAVSTELVRMTRQGVGGVARTGKGRYEIRQETKEAPIKGL